MIKIHRPTSPLDAAVELPYSKSLLNRFLILNHLAKGSKSFPSRGPTISNDCLIMKRCLDALPSSSVLDVEDAGTAMRFLTALSCLENKEVTIQGTERMHKRPIGPLVQALRSLGAEIDYLGQEGCPPLKIDGQNVKGGSISIRGDVSSQFISALLMIAPKLDGGLELTIEAPVFSEPYIDMTLSQMHRFGVAYSIDDNTIHIPEQEVGQAEIDVERDWSAAAFWYAILAVAGKGRLILTGLSFENMQGDSACIELFARLGVSTSEVADQGLLLEYTRNHADILVQDCTDFPDLAQALAFCCAGLGISCHLTGLDTLPGKETDRIVAIASELKKVGVDCETTSDSLRFSATQIEESTEAFEVYDDHRMAMGLTCLSMKWMTLNLDTDSSVVAKSYPDFWKEIEKVGFGLELIA